MFIRATPRTDRKSGKKYNAYQLVRTVRTPAGPRQEVLLYLSVDLKLDSLDKEELKTLSRKVKSLSGGEQLLLPVPKKLEELAHTIVSRLTKKQSEENKTSKKKTHEVDLDSIETENSRTVGAEQLVFQALQELELPKKLRELGLTRKYTDAILGSIIARAVKPASEHATWKWLKDQSGVDELLDTDFSQLNLSTLYRAADKVFASQGKIEEHLSTQEKELFDLEETIILYDLTNTFFEGTASINPKAKRGRSKEKRFDCPLVTLGVVLDSEGFAKKTQVFPGNVYEGNTFQKVMQSLKPLSFKKPTVVIDGGISTKDNLKWLKDNGYHYIVMLKKNLHISKDMVADGVLVKSDEKQEVRVCKSSETIDGDTSFYCYSRARELKQASIKSMMQKRFEEQLIHLKEGLIKPRCLKKYDRVLRKVGRLQERYPKISRYYTVEAIPSPDLKTAVDLKFSCDEESLKDQLCGTYCLRTTHTDFSETEAWKTYVMLTEVEATFRSLKTEMGLRPVYHHREDRVDSHLFISILAYHAISVLRHRLRCAGITDSWTTIRNGFANMTRVTISVEAKNCDRIYIRRTTKPTRYQEEILQALNYPADLLSTCTTIL